MPQFGTYTDSRDGHVYRTVLMPDGKWWFAENFAYVGSGTDYNNVVANRATYGRLYTQAEMNSSLPAGCHAPTYVEFLVLQTWANPSTFDTKNLGGALTSTTIWPTPGLDSLGFAFLPGGIWQSGSYQLLGTYGSLHGTNCYLRVQGSSGIPAAGIGIPGDTVSRFSVRYLVDSGNVPDAPAFYGNPFQILTPCTLQMLCDSKVTNSSSGRRRTVSRDSSFVFSATLNLPSECEQFESVAYYNFPAIGDCEIRQLDLVKYTFRDTEKTSSVKCMIVPGSTTKRTGDFRISCEPNISVDEAMLVATGSSSLEVLSSSRALSLKCVWTVSFLAATQFIEWLRGSVNRIFTTSVGGMKGVACQIGDSVSLEIGSTDVKISADLAVVNTKQFPLNVTASRVGNVVTVSTGTGYTGTLVNRSGEIVEVVATHTNVLTFTTYPENCYLLIREGNNVTEWLEL